MQISPLIISLVMLANAERAEPLTLAPDLTIMAQVRADYLCGRKLSHDGFKDFVSALPYSNVGENLAKDTGDATSTHQRFMKSPLHKANIVDKRYTHMGVGSACGVTVELFGKAVAKK